MPQQKFTIDIDERYTPREREAIARDIVDKILEKTLAGRDKNNETFPSYSKEYKNSVDFKAAGKSGKVNLRLSGDMLLALGEYIRTRAGKITIGYTKDSPENGKVEGNIKGTYGSTSSVKKDPKTGKTVSRKIKKRDFLGIYQKDLENILKKYPLTGKKAEEKRLENVLLVEELVKKSETFADKFATAFDSEVSRQEEAENAE